MNTMMLGRPVRIQRLGAPLPWRPPTASQMSLRNKLGQEDAPAAPQGIFDNRLVRVVTNGGAAAIGFYTGVNSSGVWSTVGWVVGVVSSLAAVNELLSLKS